MAEERIDIVVTERGSREVKRNLQDIGDGAQGSAASVDYLKRTLQTIGAGLLLRETLQTIDAFTNLQNRLRATGIEGGNLAAVYQSLLSVSNETRSSLSGSIELYSRLAISSKELGVTQGDLIQFTKSLNQAIILSGASAMEAQAGLIQLSQGMASGTLRGDELRSVLEQLPAVADVIAKHLGVTRGELRQLGQDGKISAKDILESFAAAREELDTRFSKTAATMGQSFQILKNNVTDLVGNLDKLTGTSQFISGTVLRSLSDGVAGASANLRELIPIVDALAGVIAGRLVVALAQMTANLGAAGALRAAMLLLGGPAGAVVVATGALIGYIASLEKTADKTARLKAETDALSVGLASLSRVQLENRLNQVNSKIQETTDALTAQTRQVETLQGMAGKPGFTVTAADVTAAKAAEEDLQRILQSEFQTRKDIVEQIQTGGQVAQANATATQTKEQQLAAALRDVLSAQSDKLALDQQELESLKQGEAAHNQFLIQRAAEKHIAEALKVLGVEKIEQLGAEGEALKAMALKMAVAESAVSNYGKTSKQSLTDAQKAAEQHRLELQRIVDVSNPLMAKERELTAQIATLDQAISKESGDTKTLVQAKEALAKQLDALRNPMVAVTEAHQKTVEELQKELDALRGGADAYDAYLSQKRIEETAQQRINALLAQGRDLRQEDRDAIYAQATAEEQLRGKIEAEKSARVESNHAWDAFLTEIVGSFIDSADSIGQVWTDILGRLRREVLNFGAGSLLGLSPASTPLLSGIGQLLGVGSAAASGGKGAGTSLSVNSLLSAGKLFPGFEARTLAWTNDLAMQGGLAGDVGLGLSNAANTLSGAPGGLAVGSLATAGVGWLGGQLGGKVFGVQPGMGSQLGGLGGGIASAAMLSQFGWAAGPLGALAGAFVGSAVDKVLGGDGPEVRAAVFAGQGVGKAESKWTVASQTGASGLQFAGEAQRVGEDGKKAVQDMVQQFNTLDTALTQLTKSAGLNVDLSKATNFGTGEFQVGPESAKEFVRSWIDAVSEPFDSELKAAAKSLVGNTAEDLVAAYQSLLQVRDSIQSGGIFAGLGSLTQIIQAVKPEDIQRTLAFSNQLKGITQLMSADTLKTWEESQRSVYDLWKAQGDAIVSAADVAATEQDFTALTAAMQDRYATELKLVDEIQNALKSASEQFARTSETIFLDGLKSEQEKYDFFKSRADAIAASVATLTDPAAISRAATDYNNAVLSAYNSLGPEARDLMRGEILSTLTDVGKLIDDRLNATLDSVKVDNSKDVPGSVANAVEAAMERATAAMTKSLTDAINGFVSSTTENQQAADTQFASAQLFRDWVRNLPDNINVVVSSGSEVAT